MVQKKPKQDLLHSLIDIITFDHADVVYILKNKKLVSDWLVSVIKKEGYLVGSINYTFCSDEYLLKINKKHLNHNTYTDIITFDLSENGIISSDVYISVDRVRENAKSLKTGIRNEMLRVIVHGVLHLCGYKDKTSNESKIMRGKEDNYLLMLDKPRFHVKTS